MDVELRYCSNETRFNSSSNTTIVHPAKSLKKNIERSINSQGDRGIKGIKAVPLGN